MNFISIDVETANPDFASICQVGIAKYENGKLIDEWVSFVNPEDYFSPINIRLGGLDEQTIKKIESSPTIKDLSEKIYDYLNNSIVVSHTSFDRVALDQAFKKHDLTPPEPIWLDSARVARRTWEEYSQSGYGLVNVCSRFGYTFKNHDALEDAKASAFILLKAIEESGLSLEEWLVRANKKPTSSSQDVRMEGNPDGVLYGDYIVFTGSLNMTRKEAAHFAALAGCNVQNGVNKQTSILVVGNQDITRLAGKSKSNKHVKAEELIMKGQDIRIIGEKDFEELVKLVQ